MHSTIHHRRLRALPLAVAATLPLAAFADDVPVKKLGVVSITGGRSALPSQIPTTMESVTAEQIDATVNATDSEDALKYLPSLLVRKRYIGDFNHAVLSTRASGTGNSARSLVYADGILLSNLLGNGAAFTPRWALVTPEEIERVDVMYGPFSAAYPGNSVGAVVDYLTRMPTRFEAHAKVGAFTQPFDLYDTRATYSGWQSSASLGDRQGRLAWWINANHLDSQGQPLVFATRSVASGTPGNSGVPVAGAVPGLDRSNSPWLILGTSSQYRTLQDHLKVKLDVTLSDALHTAYTFGAWDNRATGKADSYLRDAAGAPVYSGPISIGGLDYSAARGAKAGLLPADFAGSREAMSHQMHALMLRSHGDDAFDWAASASVYGYLRDRVRAPTVALPAADSGGAGRITDQDGTGWNTLALKATWRPSGAGDGGAHVIDFGVQQDGFRLRSAVFTTPDWIAGDPAAFASRFDGNTRLRSVHAQDSWHLAERWKTVLGARIEHWDAFGGSTQSAYTGNVTQSQCDAATQRCSLVHPTRSASFISPKAALGYQLTNAWVLKASTGRAIRFPTVSELYQGGVNALGQAINNNPDLRPERSWTTELGAEWTGSAGSLRLTAFHEATRDGLFSQLNAATNSNTVQNVDRLRTVGLEAALQAQDLWAKGLDLASSVTLADSKVLANAALPASVGKRQIRVPKWRANAVATWRVDEHWTTTFGARYSGSQFSTLDNSDPNGFAYQGASKFFTTDLRVRYRFDAHWSTALGIDNLNNYRYWNFHPYPQRSYSAELKYDL